MAGSSNSKLDAISNAESLNSKLNVVRSPLDDLSTRSAELEEVIERSEIVQPKIQTSTYRRLVLPSTRQENLPTQEGKEVQVGSCGTTLWAETKIFSLRQGTRSVSDYVHEFEQVARILNWNDAALMSFFYWGLNLDVKELLLYFPRPCTLDEAIDQAVKCGHRIFEREQDRISERQLQQRLQRSSRRRH